MTNEGTSGRRRVRSRRELLAVAATGVGALTGCLRFSQENAQTATDAPSATATPASTDANSPVDDETERGESTEGTPQETTAGDEFPSLDVERVDERDLGDGSSSPATKVGAIGDGRVVTVGGRQVAVLEMDSLSEVLSVDIPDVINTGHHGLRVVDGDAYVAVGGSLPSRVKRIAVDGGEQWSFVEDDFGPNVSRNVSGPVVTDDYVLYVAATTENREGDNDGQWYVLDRETGDLVEKPPMSAFEQETCFVEGIAATNDTAVLGGCSGYYFYDLSSMEYAGSEGGFLGDILEARDGIMYTGSEAYDVSEQTATWSNKSSGANRDLAVTDDRVYYIFNDEVVAVARSDGTVQWRYNFETFGPKGLTAAGDAVWVVTSNSGELPGQIVKFDAAAGDLLGATGIEPQYSNRVNAEPYGILEEAGTLFVGSAGSLLKYETN